MALTTILFTIGGYAILALAIAAIITLIITWIKFKRIAYNVKKDIKNGADNILDIETSILKK